MRADGRVLLSALLDHHADPRYCEQSGAKAGRRATEEESMEEDDGQWRDGPQPNSSVLRISARLGAKQRRRWVEVRGKSYVQVGRLHRRGRLVLLVSH